MPLYDPLNRRIDYLRVSITDRCNLRCVYCMPRERMKALPHAGILRYEEILRIVGVAASIGISHVRVTGGEPLIRRGVVELLSSLTKVRGINDVSLTTNGVLLEGMAEELLSAGISRLNISLDSLNAGKFRKITGSDMWADVWKGIEKAERLGFNPIKINVVPVRGLNNDEIADFARLTVKRQVHVRFIEFMPIGAYDRWNREECVSSDEVRAGIEREFGRLEPFTPRKGEGPSDNYRIPGAKGVLGFISPITKHFCKSCSRLRLTADGRIRPCLLSDTEIDVKAPLRSGCDDAELERLIRLALEIKPERHYLNDRPATRCERGMSRIGG